MFSPMRRSITSRFLRSSARWKLSTRTIHRAPIQSEAAQALAQSPVPNSVFANGLTLKTGSGKVRKMTEKERKALEKAIMAQKVEKERSVSSKKGSKSSKKSSSNLLQAQHLDHHMHLKSTRLSDNELRDSQSYFEEDLYQRYKTPHKSELPDLKHVKGRGYVEWDGEGEPDVRWTKDPIRYLQTLGLVVTFDTQRIGDGTLRTKTVISKEQGPPPENRRSKNKQQDSYEKLYAFWAHNEIEGVGDGRTTVSPIVILRLMDRESLSVMRRYMRSLKITAPS